VKGKENGEEKVEKGICVPSAERVLRERVPLLMVDAMRPSYERFFQNSVRRKVEEGLSRIGSEEEENEARNFKLVPRV
jgi:hypothetical protein